MRRLLIVDDDAEVRRVVRAFAVHVFDHVDEAEDGEEALAHLASSVYDTVVLDIMLPRQNGLVVYDEIRRLPSHPRVIVFSALARHFEGRFDDDVVVLQKPFGSDQLLSALLPAATD